MLETILVPRDQADPTQRALAYASMIASSAKAGLRIDGLARSLRRAIEGHRPDLIVLGVDRRARDLAVAISELIAGPAGRNAIPVLLVPAGAAGDPGDPCLPIRRVVLAIDGATEAEPALPKVTVLVTALQSHLTLFHVVEPGEDELIRPGAALERRRLARQVGLDRLAARLREEGVSCAAYADIGIAPATRLVDAAARRFDLVVLALGAAVRTSGVLGPVATAVVLASARPTLLVPTWAPEPLPGVAHRSPPPRTVRTSPVA